MHDVIVILWSPQIQDPQTTPQPVPSYVADTCRLKRLQFQGFFPGKIGEVIW